MPIRLLAALAQHATLAAICVRILRLYSPAFAMFLSVLFVVSHALANKMVHTMFSCSMTFVASCVLLASVDHIAATCIAILGLGFAPVAYPLYLAFDAPGEEPPAHYVHRLSVRYRLSAWVALLGSNMGYTLGASSYFFIAMLPLHLLIAFMTRSWTPERRVTFVENSTMERSNYEIGDEGGIEGGEDGDGEEDAKDDFEPYRVETQSAAASSIPEGLTPSVRAFMEATRAERKADAISDVVIDGQDQTVMTEAREALRQLGRTIRYTAAMGANYLALQMLERRLSMVVVAMVMGGLWVATFSLERLTGSTGAFKDTLGPNVLNMLVVGLMFWRGRYATVQTVFTSWRTIWLTAWLGFLVFLWAPPLAMAFVLAILEGVGYAATAFWPLEWMVTAYHQGRDPYPEWAWLWTAFHCARVVAMGFSVLGAYQAVLAVVGLWLVVGHLRPRQPEDSAPSPHFPLCRSTEKSALRWYLW